MTELASNRQKKFNTLPWYVARLPVGKIHSIFLDDLFSLGLARLRFARMVDPLGIRNPSCFSTCSQSSA